MLGRTFVCMIVTLGTAMPAAAGERPGYSPAPDALRLLMQDESATFSPRLPALDIGFGGATSIAARPEPGPTTLAEFETLTPSAAIIRARQVRDLAGAAAFPGRIAVLPEDTTASFGGRYAIDDAMAAYPRPYRPRAVFDTMVTVRLDGEEKTRSFSVSGGVAGAVWGALPREIE